MKTDEVTIDAAMTRPVAEWTSLDRMLQTARAQALAVAAHTGQVDKVDVDYIAHPAAVSQQFDPITQTVEHCAGWLHDVIEDTDVHEARLRLAGIHPDIIGVVSLLTRPDEGDPDDYYRRIAEHPAARAVKIADITHNTDPARVAQLGVDQRARLRAKYEHALELLGAEWPDHENLAAGHRAGASGKTQ